MLRFGVKILYGVSLVLLFLLARLLDAPTSHPAPAVVEPALIAEAVVSPATQELPVVLRVIDGDTIVVKIAGIEEKVRLIGINTPETVDSRKKVECFGREASEKAKELLKDMTVRVEKDPSQGERDKYGRLLAYLFRDDGLFFNQHMIEAGYAYEYTYKKPYRYQSEFKAAQILAQKEARGLWAPGVCAQK